MREDYSDNGQAWDYFTHDQARSRAYRWGEDGIAGISDDQQTLCFALAFWNGRDPILKERLFGLTNSESNHGEDVKEYYYYLDSTPTHSYMKYLYKYPQAPYPHDEIVATSRSRGRHEPEYELIDTGVFADDRYFDILVEYAKAGPDDILIEITAHNRGPDSAQLDALPTLWFRNQWSWNPGAPRPSLRQIGRRPVIRAADAALGEFSLACADAPDLIFTENETNMRRLFGAENGSRYVKDAFHSYVVEGRSDAVNPERTGTKAAAHYRLTIPALQMRRLRLRLSRLGAPALARFGVAYLPAESDSGMFGGNSNWRGPIGMPTNALVVRALLQYYGYYGDRFKVECPTGSGRLMTLYEVAEELSQRLARIFLRDREDRRPVFGGAAKFQEDAQWRDCLLFYEYFHGDNGAGIGASHQTGWSGLVARLIHLFATMTPEQMLIRKSSYAESARYAASPDGEAAR